MENLQNDPNLQAQQVAAQQMQAKMLLEIVQKAGLDANNAEHQKMAAEVLKNVFELQDPAREKELHGAMREFGLQPDEFKKAIEGFQAQGKQLEQKMSTLNTQEEGLAAKFRKNKTIGAIIGVVAGIAAAAFANKKWLKESKTWKKVLGIAGSFLGGSAVVGGIAGVFTTKPIQKEALALEGQKEKIYVEGEQLGVQAQELQYNMIRDLSAGMLKTRAEVAAKAPATPAPVVSVPKKPVEASVAPKDSHAAAHAAPEKKSVVEKVLDKAKAPIDKVLGNAPAGSNLEKAEASKAAAAEAQTSR